MRTETVARGALGLVVALLGAGCSDPVTAESVIGVYQATEFTITLNNARTDLLAGGASVTLELHSGGATSGHFLLPVTPGVSTVEVDDDLTGTFVVNNGIVRLTQAADTYIKDFLFVAADGQLRASQVIQSGDVNGNLRLVLTRQ
jgi:hypothetical protein